MRFTQGPEEPENMGRLKLTLCIFAGLFIATTSCLLDSDEDTYGIDGYVRDAGGQPVNGVLIRKTGNESGSTYTRSSGYYWIPVSRRSEEVALIAAKTGWAFCPGRREFTHFAERYHDQDFTGFYGGDVVIEGFVHDSAGNSVEGVKVVNREPGIFNGLTSVTNYLGYYRFGNIIAGYTYRFVPARPGCIFNPSERTYAFPARDYLHQDFTISCVESFGIEGRVTDPEGDPVEGVTLLITPDNVTAVTGEDGYYSKKGLVPSEGMEVSPSKEGCVFNPESAGILAPFGNIGDVDFVVYCGEAYSVSGQVLYGEGIPLPDIQVSIEGGCCPPSRMSLTDGAGRYSFAGLRDGFDYVIKPELKEFAVAPESILIERLDRDYVEQDFVFSSEIIDFRVSGYIRDNHGTPLEGKVVEFAYLTTRSDEPAAPPGGVPDAPLLDVTTDDEGYFSLPVLGGMTVMFYPVEEGCYFIPYARWCYGDRDHESQDFGAHCGGGAAISGYVKDASGRPARQVRVEVRGDGYFPRPFARTDSAGYYEVSNLPNGLELTARPSADYSIPYEGCIFCPSERVYDSIEEDYADQNFTLSCPRP
jgi:protocatechuate 3,4-dioxygenase beta subunit